MTEPWTDEELSAKQQCADKYPGFVPDDVRWLATLARLRADAQTEISDLNRQLNASEAELEEAHLLIHNCLLVLPDGSFKREVEEWLTAALAASPTEQAILPP